ncbi:O-antigen ligase [Marivirga sericea]|uniref:O-antigen ligase n=1 Tax=Marivirga sericea TaxID=1028 RepID=A0A1X7IAN0_9BACT|nr:O-antigen ligase family protein [Marivirga sericea]SMG11296.1 O-antigen ligase [Marivirga sericea]
MRTTSQNIDHDIFFKKVNRLLLVILLLMVACFFTWSENVLITRAIKVVGRMGVLFGSYLVYKKIIAYGAIDNLKWHNVPSIFMYVLYLLLGFASFLWTTNIGVSALQWFMTTQTLVFCYFFIKCLYLLDKFFPEHKIRLFNLLGNVCFVLITIFVVGMWVNPDVFFRYTHGGEEARLGGYMMNPNELGMLAGVGVAGLLFDLKRDHKKAWTIFKLLVLFYGLYATGSRSSLIGALLIIGFHVKQSSNTKLKILIITGMIVVAPVAIYKVVLKDGDSSRIEEVLSMTGRLPFWTALINEGLPREPMLGFGFMRIDYKEYFQSTHTYPGKMTHNTFLQVLMNLGFVGITIVIFQMIFTFKGISKEHSEKRLMLLSMLIPLIINSLTEFGIFGESNYGILFYQLIILYISFKQNDILTPAQKLYLKKRRPDLVY